ncbi:hypothetical protein SCLCIDRAFT_18906 [Scleroderma citrinum Foug A]|uniref:Uncharacterized protein n=1 Tax=Scleroderma citrinum Foug A TaxID=1036808 RepID=A0A0C3AY03_9AGAM|nr:hypothetical protein SCLCIDRAFT_18906 [Scleroderma citrinum Foug A]
MVLHKVADDPKWQKICQEGDCRHQEAAAARLKKHGPSHKHPHTETMNSGNTPEGLGGPLLPDLPMVPPPVSPVHERMNALISPEESHCPSAPSMPAPQLPSRQHEDFRHAPSIPPHQNPHHAPLVPPTHDLQQVPSIPPSQDPHRTPSIPPPPGWHQYPPQPGPLRPHHNSLHLPGNPRPHFPPPSFL